MHLGVPSSGLVLWDVAEVHSVVLALARKNCSHPCRLSQLILVCSVHLSSWSLFKVFAKPPLWTQLRRAA